MDKHFFKTIALATDLTTYHYKIVLLLLDGERTQSQLAAELLTSKQNVNKTCKTLLAYGIIEVARQEGNLKYLRVNTKIKDLPMVGQIKLNDI